MKRPMTTEDQIEELAGQSPRQEAKSGPNPEQAIKLREAHEGWAQRGERLSTRRTWARAQPAGLMVEFIGLPEECAVSTERAEEIDREQAELERIGFIL